MICADSNRWINLKAVQFRISLFPFTALITFEILLDVMNVFVCYYGDISFSKLYCMSVDILKDLIYVEIPANLS